MKYGDISVNRCLSGTSLQSSVYFLEADTGHLSIGCQSTTHYSWKYGEMSVNWCATDRQTQTCMFDLDLWPFDLDLWSTSTSQQYLSCVCASSMCNHWLMIYSQNTYFHKIAYLTLTFDLVTLTFGQHQHLINTYHMYKYHSYPIIGSWYIVKTSFSQNCIFDLDLWPCDLDLRSTLTSHWYQSYLQVSSISNHWFMVYSQIHFYKLVFLAFLDLWPCDLDL